MANFIDEIKSYWALKYKKYKKYKIITFFLKTRKQKLLSYIFEIITTPDPNLQPAKHNFK